MYLTHLSLTNFRAFARLDMDVPRRILLLVGNNAQGKTSLLEAVYYLATFSSFHAQSDRQLINFLAKGDDLTVARIVIQFQRNNQSHKMEVRLIQENAGNGGTRTRKEILVNGVKRSAQDALGHFNAVIFLPQMMRIIEESPEDRRRYLNLAISQIMPGYAQALSEYNQAVTQRNALLKQLNERGGDASQLDYWDQLLGERGSILVHTRIAAIRELEAVAQPIHQKLTGGEEVLRMQYQPSYDPLPQPEGQFVLKFTSQADRSGFSLEEIRAGFIQRLAALRSEEVARGVTTIGPHRDEMRILANGIDLGDYGSRGQARTALLSLKLAEVAWMKEKTGEWPVLLLDETMAELDVTRRADLLAYLGDCEQGLLTTTDLHLFAPEFVDKCTVWAVEGGRVLAKAEENG
ncbi:MAG TPA: DNA replication/repair protein RecF [Longilinea sp.]|nr:DNA replication/repair protein RecF [Longilinea sp.]